MEKSNFKNFEGLLASEISHENALQEIIEEYEEITVNLIMAHTICCHYTNMKELNEIHQNAMFALWRTIGALLQAGYNKMTVEKKEQE